ncbi:MAG: hypothetical protein FWC76_01355 [Defluviitaleaceae bacterium]|nr:hypothetical protein [Defluviitaleaceae bacterium]
MKAPGATTLLVVSILLIIGAAIGLVLGGLALLGAAYLETIGEPLTGAEWFDVITLFITAIWQLIVAIICIANRNKLEKGSLLAGLSISIIVIAALSIVYGFVIGDDFQFTGIAGLLLPFLLHSGASKNKKAFEMQSEA